MKNKIQLFILIVGLILFLFVGIQMASASTLYEKYTENDDDMVNIGGVYYRGQTFTPSITHRIESVRVLVYRETISGTLTLHIRNTADEKPVGNDLASGSVNTENFTTSTSGNWETIGLDKSVLLRAGTQYAIILSFDGSNTKWRQDTSTSTYEGGSYVWSNNSGVNWNKYPESPIIDCLFEEWGYRPLITTPENAIASTTAYIGDLFETFGNFIWLIIGVPLGFWILIEILVLTAPKKDKKLVKVMRDSHIKRTKRELRSWLKADRENDKREMKRWEKANRY